MFSPLIVNDYINQLEALKRDGKENTRDTKDILELYNSIDKTLNNIEFDLYSDNSWLLNCIGKYYQDKNDYQKAIEWYTKSANLNNFHAMNNLGYYYYYTMFNYNILNDKKAIEWYIKSANLGSIDAMLNLGRCYYNINNCEKAIEWYIKFINLDTNYLKNIGWYDESNLNKCLCSLKNIKIEETNYDYIYELLSIQNNLEIKDILLDKLPNKYIYNKKEEQINNLKSIKTQGIDKVLINSIFKHF